MRFCPGNRIRHGYDLEWYRKRNPSSLDWREVECAPRVFLSNEQAIDLMIGNDMRRHTQEMLAHTERTQGDVSSPVTSFFACLDGTTVAHMVDVTNSHLRERGYDATQAGEFMCFWAVIILRLALQTTYHGVQEHVDAASWASAPTHHRFKQLFSCLRLHFNGVSHDRQVCLLLSLCVGFTCSHSPGVQDTLRSVRHLERLVFGNARRLLLRNGAWVSIDDWKWAYQGSDMPLRMAIPGKHHQYGWVAENGAAVGLGFLVSSVKRGTLEGDNMRMMSARNGMEEVFKQLAETNETDGGVAFDRGYTCLDSALLGTCPYANWDVIQGVIPRLCAVECVVHHDSRQVQLQTRRRVGLSSVSPDRGIRRRRQAT